MATEDAVQSNVSAIRPFKSQITATLGRNLFFLLFCLVCFNVQTEKKNEKSSWGEKVKNQKALKLPGGRKVFVIKKRENKMFAITGLWL